MQVRDATEDDIEAIRAVADAAWHRDYPDALSQETIEAGVGHWYGDAVVRMELSNPGTDFRVAEIDGRVVGFVHGNQAGPAVTILRLHVHPEYRDRDVAEELLEAIELELDTDEEPLRATVLEANEHMMSFYAAHGFKRIKSDRTTIGDGQHPEVVFERP